MYLLQEFMISKGNIDFEALIIIWEKLSNLNSVISFGLLLQRIVIELEPSYSL